MSRIKLKREDILDIDLENACFHFTNKDNLIGIDQKGLVPRIGENANGIEKTPKIFFAKGVKGALEICNVWIRWFIYKKQHKNYHRGIDHPVDSVLANLKFNQDFIDGKIYTEEIKQECFEEFYNYMKENRYLILDLQEGIDYSENDIDEKKADLISRKREDLLVAMYGKVDTTSEDKYKMERWNMHTIAGVTISQDKIQILKDGDKYSALDIIQTLREKVNNNTLDLGLLDEFLEYTKHKFVEDEQAIELTC